jgi:hypothetical protein
MIERNRSDCTYVEIFTHHVGSIGAPRRGTNTKQWEVPNTATSNTKTNILREGSAGFKATINMNKKSTSR